MMMNLSRFSKILMIYHLLMIYHQLNFFEVLRLYYCCANFTQRFCDKFKRDDNCNI